MPTTSAARAELRRLRARPAPLPRPVVVLSGWGDPGVIAWQVAQVLRRTTGEQRVADISFLLSFTFAACRAKVVSRVEALWPSSHPHETVEVDVVAHSMGGLVARYAALPAGTPGFDAPLAPTGKRLRVRTLHTVATPHRGANQARLAHKVDPRAKAMMPGSDFLKALDAAGRQSAIIPYGIEGDWVVGLENAVHADAAPEEGLRRFSRRLLRPSHAGATTDPRVMLEIVKHLRAG